MFQQSQKKERIVYLDHLKVFVIILVILLHVAVTYGPIGSWYYFQRTEDFISNLVLALFAAFNQFFFMGLLFFISGYFVPGSYERKGVKKFVVDRLIRLGVPLIVYSFVLHPVLIYTREVWIGTTDSFLQLYEVESGPLWFVQALLLFSFGYVLWRRIALSIKEKMRLQSFPSNKDLMIWVFILTFVSFIVRFWYPIDKDFFNMQLAFFPQYIIAFIAGILAFRNNWLIQMSFSKIKMWIPIVILGLLAIPILIATGGAFEGNDYMYEGGLYWQAFAMAFNEIVVFVGMSMILLFFFKEKLNEKIKWTSFLSRNAFTVYIIHAPIVVWVSLLVRNSSLHPLLMFLLVSCISVPLCFVLSEYVVRKIPGADKIL
jgi:glucans biosynthesis protein C